MFSRVFGRDAEFSGAGSGTAFQWGGDLTLPSAGLGADGGTSFQESSLSTTSTAELSRVLDRSAFSDAPLTQLSEQERTALTRQTIQELGRRGEEGFPALSSHFARLSNSGEEAREVAQSLFQSRHGAIFLLSNLSNFSGAQRESILNALLHSVEKEGEGVMQHLSPRELSNALGVLREVFAGSDAALQTVGLSVLDGVLTHLSLRSVSEPQGAGSREVRHALELLSPKIRNMTRDFMANENHTGLFPQAMRLLSRVAEPRDVPFALQYAHGPNVSDPLRHAAQQILRSQIRALSNA